MTAAKPARTREETEGRFDLRAFSVENRARCESPTGFNHALTSWSLSDWMTATLGELGEAANVAKKLNRVRDGIPGNKETPDELRAAFADEIADAFIYLDLMAQAAGVDLPQAVRGKFDRTSDKIGYCPASLPASQPAPEPPAPQGVDANLIERCKEIIAWQNTGYLPGDALRTFGKSLNVGEHHELSVAENKTARAAMEYVVAHAAPPPPADAQVRERAARIVMEGEHCGLILSGERVFCTDTRLDDDLRRGSCECKDIADALVSASLLHDPAQVERLTRERDEAKLKLGVYADSADVCGMSWSGFNLIGGYKSIREVQRLQCVESRMAYLEERVKETESALAERTRERDEARAARDIAQELEQAAVEDYAEANATLAERDAEIARLRAAMETAIDAMNFYMLPSAMDGGIGECAAITNAKAAIETARAALAPAPVKEGE